MDDDATSGDSHKHNPKYIRRVINISQKMNYHQSTKSIFCGSAPYCHNGVSFIFLLAS